MRLVKDACPILRARRYIKAGRIWRALRPLLGNGLILAEGADHIRQRQQIGAALRKIPQADIDAAVRSFSWPDVGARVDLAKVMLQLAEHVMRRVLFGVDSGPNVGSAGGPCGAGDADPLATPAAGPAAEAGPDALATQGDRGQVGLTSFAQICRHNS